METVELDRVLAKAVLRAAEIREGSYVKVARRVSVGEYSMTLHEACQQACREHGLGPFATSLVSTAVLYDWNTVIEEAFAL